MTPSDRLPYLDDPRALARARSGEVPAAAENPFSALGDRTPAAGPAGKPAAEEESSLPIDPWRILWGLRRRKRWLWLGALAGLSLGTGFGMLKMHTRYEATFQLIKRYTPPTLQVSTTGEPYRPRQFANSTLASAASSPNVLERVSRKSNPTVSPEQLKLVTNVKEDKVTDFVTLTIAGNLSAENTVDLAKIWSDEIINFTREIQSQESREIRKVIQSQLDANQTDLQGIDSQLAKFSGGGQLLGADSQAGTFVRLQEEVDTRYDTARVELDSITSQLDGLKSELQRHTPMSEELRQAKAELIAFQARYTDKNPLVVERMEKIASLEAQLKQQQESKVPLDPSDLNNHSGTAIGDQLYMRLVELENQRGVAERQVADLTKQHDMYAKSPEKVSQIMELLQRKEMLRTAQAMLLGRFQEVKIYEDNAPAFYGVFAPPEVEQVAVSTKLFKVSILAVVGTVVGTFFGLGTVLLLTVADPRLRTRGEAAKAAGAPLMVSLAGGEARSEAVDEAAAAALWTRWLGTQGDARRLRTVWCTGGHAGEEDFWRMILAQAHRLLPGLLVIDGGRTPSPALAELPQGSLTEWQPGPAFAAVSCPVPALALAQVRDLQYFIESRLTEGMEVWLRLDGPVREPALGIVRAAGSAPLLIASLHDTTTGSFLGEQAGLLRTVGLPPCGVVATNDAAAPVSA